MAAATTQALTSKSKSSNPSTFSGVVDIIIVKHDNKTFKSTPFHVRFGKYLVGLPFNLNVSMTINDEPIDNLCMTLNKNGIAHFDGPQPDDENKQKHEKEEKAETIITDDGSSKNNKKQTRKRDKLRAFAQSSWSYWGGSENQNQEKEEKKTKKRYLVKNYITNKLASQWMTEDDVIDINNIPNNEQIKLFISKLKNGKNNIVFTIKTPSKMDKFKKRIYKKTKTKNIKEIQANEDSDDEVISDMMNLNITKTGNDFKLKERNVFGNIYLWNNLDKIIISDVDGTITKSDLGGHILPKIGFDYVQNGVCKILNRLNSSRYRIIYLTARGIGQSSITRKYLFKELNVPNGAVICSASTIRAALYREVIQKRPQDFKIQTLKMIGHAFNNNNPFVGGFGNRDTDSKTYKYFGIHKTKIFIIGLNKKEKEKQQQDEQEVIATYIDDYNQIFEKINDIFPKLINAHQD